MCTVLTFISLNYIYIIIINVQENKLNVKKNVITQLKFFKCICCMSPQMLGHNIY